MVGQRDLKDVTQVFSDLEYNVDSGSILVSFCFPAEISVLEIYLIILLI